MPSVVAAVFAEVELDAETGLARARKLVLAPVGADASPLGAWEDGQIAAALPLVFGGPAPATAMDVPTIARAGEPPEGDALAIPPLADLVPAAAAALAHAISDGGRSPRSGAAGPARDAARALRPVVVDEPVRPDPTRQRGGATRAAPPPRLRPPPGLRARATAGRTCAPT